MESNQVFRAFVSSASQYFTSPIKPNFINLQKHLDAIAALSASSLGKKEFDPEFLPVSECFACLTDIITKKCNETSLVKQVFIVLGNLANSPVVKALESAFKLHSALFIFLANYGSDDVEDQLVLQCLELLVVYTEDVPISYVDESLKYLINTLIIEIKKTSSKILALALHILANLCRNNLAVQLYINSLANLKQIYKSILKNLNGPSDCCIIYTFLIITSLQRTCYLHEKVFTSKELKNAFEFIAVLLKKDETFSDAALNLLHDLLNVDQNRRFLLKYPKVEVAIRFIIDSFSDETSVEQSTRFLKFIWAFAKHLECRKSVISCLSIEKKSSDVPHSNKLHLLVKKWSTKSVDEAGEAPFYALKILCAMVEVSDANILNSLQPCFQNLVATLLSNNVQSTLASTLSQVHLDTLTTTFDLLLLFLKKDMFKEIILENLNVMDCQNLIKVLLQKNVVLHKDSKWSSSSIDLLLSVLHVLVSTRDFLPITHLFIEEIFQDHRLISVLAYGLRSSLPVRVERSLFLIQMAKPGISLSLLSTAICSLQSSSERSLIPCNVKVCENKPSEKDLDKKVERLLLRIEGGMELQELKTSEIIQLCMHKMSSLNLQLMEQKDLAETKSQALHHANMMLDKYLRLEHQRKCEELNILSALENSESHSEDARLELQEVQKVLLSTEEDLKTKEREFKESWEEQNEHIEQLKKSIKENLKQIDDMNVRLEEKEQIIEDLKTECMKLENDLNKKSETLENVLKDKEKEREKFKREISAMEMACVKRDATIKEMAKQNEELAVEKSTILEELEQLKYITNMIHQMSSKSTKREEKSNS